MARVITEGAEDKQDKCSEGLSLLFRQIF
ncbi:MAG: hypothetical protein ACTS8R_01500 [Arsenophonus sp. NC-QC1-MAG3]